MIFGNRMKNEVNIHSDDVSMRLTFKVSAGAAAKVMLTLFNITIIALYIFFVVDIEMHHLRKWIIPSVFIGFLLISLPLRHFLWTMLGKEILIINKKEITYYYDYIVLKTNHDTITHHKLDTSYEFVRKYGNEEHGRLHLFSYDPETNTRKEIYHTTGLISKKDLTQIQNLISELFNEQSGDSASAALAS